jgi:hypothetical protein
MLFSFFRNFQPPSLNPWAPMPSSVVETIRAEA